MDCEFCLEFQNEQSGRYRAIYGPTAPSRLVAQNQAFAILPTLGQLFTGSLLFVPHQHIETLAALTREDLRQLSELVLRAIKMTKHLGHPIVFEHGAQQSTGAGCGIYHAHLHLVPTPSPITWDTLFPFEGESASNLETALQLLHERGSEHYLLLGDAFGSIRFTNISKDMFPSIGSQYIRRRLAETFGLKASWNWKHYEEPQPELLTTLELFSHNDPQ